MHGSSSVVVVFLFLAFVFSHLGGNVRAAKYKLFRGSAACTEYLPSSPELFMENNTVCRYGVLSTDDAPGNDCYNK